MVKIPRKQDIARLSRDRPFLFKTILTLGTASAALAMVISLVSYNFIDREKKKEASEPETLSEIATAIRNPDYAGFPHSHTDFRFLKPDSESDEKESSESPLPKLITKSERLSDIEKDLLLQLFQGIRFKNKRRGAIEVLNSRPKNARFRNEFLGDLYFLSGEKDQALSHYLAEGTTFPEARYSQRSALFELWNRHNFDQFQSLIKKPGFRDALSKSELMPIQTDARNYPRLLGLIFQHSMDQLRFPELIPPFFTALIWALILLVFCRINKRIVLLSLAAFFLGMMSASLTLFAVYIQEQIQGFTEANTTTPLSELIYWVAGVGLREESIKLLCFIPIAIWILPEKNHLQALILAGMVGLGFACEENFAYFDHAPGNSVIWSRFLTANALHFSLTGVVGYYFFRMLVRKGWGMEDFILYFLIAVASHGFYNALISMASLSSYAPLGTVVLALIAYLYFDLLRDHIDIISLHRRISPLGVFVLGSAVLLYSIMIFSSGLNSFGKAFSDFSLSMGAMIPLAFAFISRFRDI